MLKWVLAVLPYCHFVSSLCRFGVCSEHHHPLPRGSVSSCAGDVQAKRCAGWRYRCCSRCFTPLARLRRCRRAAGLRPAAASSVSLVPLQRCTFAYSTQCHARGMWGCVHAMISSARVLAPPLLPCTQHLPSSAPCSQACKLSAGCSASRASLPPCKTHGGGTAGVVTSTGPNDRG